MPASSIGLHDWIVLSNRYEVEFVNHPTNSSGKSGINRGGQLAYAERSARVAFLLLYFLIDHPCTLHAEDILVENFVAEIALENDFTAGSNISTLPNLSGSIVKAIVEGITRIDFAPNTNHKFVAKDHMESHEYFQSIGWLLYQLFSRGEEPLTRVGLKYANSCQPDAPKRSEEVDEKAEDEEYGDEMSRRNKSVGGACKSLRAMDISKEGDQMLLSKAPASIRRLVGDLIRSGHDIEDNFESFEDIFIEMKQIIDTPGILLYDADSSTIGQLNFGNKLFGRSQEMLSLLTAAERILLGADALINNIVLIGGHSGSGKSFLVKSAGTDLKRSGWMFINCKFDPVMQGQFASNIYSAFNNFFASLVASRDDNAANEEHIGNTIASSIEQSLPASGIVLLGNLMPSMKQLFPEIFRRVVSDTDLSALGNEDEVNITSEGHVDGENQEADISNPETLKNRLHFLFRRLLRAMSNSGMPLIFFLDDLQWAERASLDLLKSLVMDFDHIQPLDDEFGERAQRVLFVVSYRSNEVSESLILATYFAEFVSSSSVHITNIQLDGMAKTGTSVMISEALRLPLRLTRRLAHVIEAKTLGNPLFVKTFMKSLVNEKILCYSLLAKRWVWNIEDVKLASIDANVAELLTKKMLQLPENIREALKVMACFGSQADEMALQLYHLSCNGRDLKYCLEYAVNEGILEKQDGVYSFAHDMLHHASQELMTKGERGERHYNIGLQLTLNMPPALDESVFDPLQFTAIDQINKAKSLGVIVDLDPSLKTLFASLNLKACERSMELSDFESGLLYAENGISLLPESKWESCYELSLRLYESACLACYINSSHDKLMSHVSVIQTNTVSFQDTLISSMVVIKALGSTGKAKEAIEKAFIILGKLGEEFPSDITPGLILQEIVSTKNLLNKSFKDASILAPKIVDATKQWAIKILEVIQPSLFLTRPTYLPIVACRIVKISAEHGYCSESAFGRWGYSHAQASILHDIEEGYRWAKNALSLLERFSAEDKYPTMKFYFHSCISFWVEPFQATPSLLKKNYASALAVGDAENAMGSNFMHGRYQLMCGGNLKVAEKQGKIHASKMLQMNQITYYFLLLSHQHLILTLTGSGENPFGMYNNTIQNEDELLEYTIANGMTTTTQDIHINMLLLAFWFKRYDEAAEIINKCRRHLVLNINDVIHVFFEGLTAFHFARCSPNEAKWMGIGENALSHMRTWVKHSTWNFENKLLLLEAEHFFSIGKREDAKNKYQASIESGRLHRFIHEEGLAMELLGKFHTENGDFDDADEQISNARSCYEKWGAFALVDLLDATHK